MGKQHLHLPLPLTLQLRTMKGGVATNFHLIVFLPSILVFWDDKGTLAGSLPQMQDSNQLPKFLVLKKPGGNKSLIEIEGKTGRTELVQKQTGRQKIESRDYSRKAKSQCKDVTFGGCPISNKKIIRSLQGFTIENCNSVCKASLRCEFYRFNHQTKECLLHWEDYKSLCQIRAAPVEAQ